MGFFDKKPLPSPNHQNKKPLFSLVQPKLKIGNSHDASEKEADNMADKVVNAQQTDFNGQPHRFNPQSKPQLKSQSVQKQSEALSTEEETIQKKSNGAGFESKLGASKGGGNPLDSNTKDEMESGFGHDLSGVKVHTDSNAIQMNKEIGAQAFTNGSDIYFNEGKYNPSSKDGKHLLAHEVTHTVQQGAVSGNTIQKKETEISTADQDKAVETKTDNEVELTKDERVELRRITGNRIDKAYTDYVDAAGQVKSEIHEAAKAQIDFMEFMAEIALGILLPGAGKALASWANNIPSSASNAKFLAAYALLDRGKTTAYLTAGTKLGTNALKKSYKNLSGLSKTDGFIAKMKEDTRNGFDKTDSNLPNLSDNELASLYIAFGTEFTNATTYKSEIYKMVKRFKQQILTIGNYSSKSTTVPPTETSYTTGVYWLEYEPKKIVLANVTLKQKKHLTRSIGGTQDSTRITFNHLVDKDLGPLAEKVGQAEQDGKVKQLTYLGVKKMKSLGLIFNYPDKFPSNKYYKTTN